ncbi:hypothetical protein D3C71_1307730 [compost metagenome]
MRILDVTADFAFGVGFRHNLPQRTVALNLDVDHFSAFEHGAHHGGCGNRAPERGGCRRIGVVSALQLGGQLGRTNRERPHSPAKRRPSHQPVFFILHGLWALPFLIKSIALVTYWFRS